MSFKFEKLIIWQKAMDFAEEISTISMTFPKKEIYNLSSQIVRASDTIALNISEGAIEQSKAEFNKLYKDCFDIMNMTIAFKSNLK